MCKVLPVSNETEIRSGHLVNFTRDYAATCCITSYILGFVDIVPNTMIFGWDDRGAQCESLSDLWGSKYIDMAQKWKTLYPGDIAVIPIQSTSGVD